MTISDHDTLCYSDYDEWGRGGEVAKVNVRIWMLVWLGAIKLTNAKNWRGEMIWILCLYESNEGYKCGMDGEDEKLGGLVEEVFCER